MAQQTAWLATVGLIVVVAGVFLRIVSSASIRADSGPAAGSVTNLRPRLLLVLSLVVLVVFWFTLRRLPYRDHAPEAQVVEFTSTQWAWQFSRDTLTVGVPVEFHVTSEDVNHGFGIYDDDDRLLIQVQAMPEYVNRLPYTFARPGRYRVLCLEYCGHLHHLMMRDLVVAAPSAAGGGR